MSKFKTPYIYKVNVEDAGRLHTLAEFTIRRSYAWCMVAGILVLVAGMGFLVGRLFTSGTVSEGKQMSVDAMLTLDSLQDVTNRNDMYIRNIFSVLDPNRNAKGDSISVVSKSISYSVDDLMDRTDAEQKFANNMDESERYSISVIAPLQAEDIEFYELCPDGVQTSESIGKELARYIIPARATVNAPTDARVVEVYYSPAEGGNVVMLQQPKGFLLRLGCLGNVLVKRGDNVRGGEAIAFGNAVSGRNKGCITVEMWHNGNRLRPGDFLTMRNATPLDNENHESEQN